MNDTDRTREELLEEIKWLREEHKRLYAYLPSASKELLKYVHTTWDALRRGETPTGTITNDTFEQGVRELKSEKD